MKTSFVHPSLGAFAYDEGLNWYEGSAAADGDRMAVYLSLDDCSDEEALVKLAERRIARLEQIVRAAKQFAAASLLQEINTQWLVPTEGEMTEAGLGSRFCAGSFTVFPDGTQEISLGPEHLLSGQCVILSSDENGDFTEATVAG